MEANSEILNFAQACRWRISEWL